MADNLPAAVPEPSGEVILYQSQDGAARIEVRLEGETVWLTQAGMANLYQTSPQNITLHLQPFTTTAKSTKSQLVRITYKFEWKGAGRSSDH